MGRVMFFLLRMAFWLSVVLVLLPSGGSQPQSGAPAIGAVEAVSAAGAAVSDMSQFCGRQPDACVVGSQAAVAFGQRAQAGAKMVIEFLGDKISSNEQGKAAKASPNAAIKASQHTLTPRQGAPHGQRSEEIQQGSP